MKKNRKSLRWRIGSLLIAALAGGILWYYRPHAATVGEALPPSEILPVPPAPPRLNGGPGYNECIDMIADDPEGALQFAHTLKGAAALHCQGLAEVELGDAELGAPILMQVGQDISQDPSTRAAILGQASRAWLMIDQAQKARRASSDALALLPNDPDLQFDDAIAAMATKDFSVAVVDLDQVLATDPKREEALVARATCLQELGKLDSAMRDANAAVKLDGDDQDALLERGIIRQHTGDIAGARADWQQVQSINPDTSSADLATQNLALLDATRN